MPQQQASPGIPCVLADDALLDDRREQGFEHTTGPRDPQAGESPVRIGDGRVGRDEARSVVVGAERPRERGQ